MSILSGTPLVAFVVMAVLLGIAPPVAAHPGHIEMRNLAEVQGFTPPVLTVDFGDEITFENLDTFASHHPISNDDDPTATSGGGVCFDAGVLDLGENITFTTTCDGIQTYRCNIHPQMRGAIRFL